MTPEQIAAIPAELKERKQWVKFRIKDGKKTPFDIHGNIASPTNPDCWSTFEELGPDPENPAYCFTEEDPYVLIDIDAVKEDPGESPEAFAARKKYAEGLKANMIMMFPGYHEVSASGNGYHIICRGVVGEGCHNAYLGIFDRKRFGIFTGNGSGDIEDADQDLLDDTVDQIRPSAGTSAESLPQCRTDEEVIDKMIQRGGRAKTIAQSGGHSLNTNTSDADYEIFSTLLEFSGNREQCLRLFEELGYVRKKKKAANYPEKTVDRALRNGKTFFDLEEFMRVLRESIEEYVTNRLKMAMNGKINTRSVVEEAEEELPQSDPVRRTPSSDGIIPTDLGDADNGVRLLRTLPKGLIRDLAFGFYGEFRYPVAEVSIIAAFGAFALAAQRGFQAHDGKALNIYMLLLAVSSAGKSPLVDGIPRLLARINPAYLEYWSEELRSEQALAKTLVEHPRNVMLIQECAPWIKAMTDRNAQGWQQSASSAFTKLYSAGGGVYKSPRTAQTPDEDLRPVRRPCFSILGEAQPGNLWKSIKSMGVSSGFLPRFIILEMDNRSLHEEAQQTREMPESVVEEMRALLKAMWEKDDYKTEEEREEEKKEKPPENGKKSRNKWGLGLWKVIPFESAAVQKKFDDYCVKWRRKLKLLEQHDSGVDSSIYGKMGENALRVAGLLAASAGWRQEHPVIREEHLDWAIELINHSSKNTVENLSSEGAEDTTEGRRKTVLHWVNKIRNMTYEEKMANKGMAAAFRKECFRSAPDIIPRSLLRIKCLNTSAFQNSRNDKAFDDILKAMHEDGDSIVSYSAEEMSKVSEGEITVPCVVAK